MPKLPRITKLQITRSKKKKRIRLGKGRYIFTDNRHPLRGVFSAFLGILSLVTIYLAIYRAALAGGNADGSGAAATFLAFIYSIAGMIFGFISSRQKDIFKLFPRLGMITSTVAFLSILGLLYLGMV